jgi:hypothetical protein
MKESGRYEFFPEFCGIVPMLQPELVSAKFIVVLASYSTLCSLLH